MKQRNKGKKALSFGASLQYGALLLFAGQLVVPFSAFAEGSRDLYPANVSSAGYRHWLNARNTTNAAAFDPFPNRGIMRVYAKAGETIYLGSSVIGLNETDIGSVTLRGPDGTMKTLERRNGSSWTTYTASQGATYGRIQNRDQELNGPNVGSMTNGYDPIRYVVPTGGDGIYEVSFLALGATGTNYPDANYNMRSNYQWGKNGNVTQPTVAASNALIVAWDVSVFDASNVYQTGRLYTNVLNLTGPNSIFNQRAFFSSFIVLTPSGFSYTVNGNGLNGASFNFFSNNKGIRTSTDPGSEPAYISYNYGSDFSSISGRIWNPLSKDDATNVTNKIFYNTPAADLPTLAPIAFGNTATTTWLRRVPSSPKLIDPYVNCSGLIKFKASITGDYRILIDADNNNSYDNEVDRIIVGTVTDTTQVISYKWDRKNGLGATIPNSQQVKVRIELNERQSEVHFPFLDVESNYDGLKIILNETPGGSTIYWDNSGSSLNPSNNGTFLSEKRKNKETGINSINGEHKWGGPNTLPTGSGIDQQYYGNNKLMDTWAIAQSKSVAFEGPLCLEYNISGNVFNDRNIDGFKNNGEYTVSGSSNTNNNQSVITGGNLYVNLVDANDNTLVATVQVNADGTYSFSNVAASVTGYKLFITEENLSNTAVKLPESKASLPMGWENVSTKVGNATANTSNPTVITLGQLNGNTTNVNFGIKAVNSTTAVPDFNITTTSTPAEGNVITNDFDKEGDAQVFGSFLNGLQVIVSGTTIAGTNSDGTPNSGAGTLNFSSNGSYEFVPGPGFTGNVKIPYFVCDVNVQSACDTSYLNIDVIDQSSNVIIANDDAYIVYGTNVTGNILQNDFDPNGGILSVASFTIDTDGDGNFETTGIIGTATVVGGYNVNGQFVANAGTLTINTDGTLNFVPNNDFVGKVLVDYVAQNDASTPKTDDASITIYVFADVNGPANDPPVPADDFLTTTKNYPKTGNFIVNDREPNGNPITVKDANNNAQLIDPNGTPVLVNTLTTVNGGQVALMSNGTYVYTPPVDFVGADFVTYQICDQVASPLVSLCATANINLFVQEGATLSGSVWNDGNGNVIIDPVEKFVSGDNTNNGGNSIVTGGAVFVSAVNASGNVIATTQVGSNGHYEIQNVQLGANISLILTTGTAAPALGSTLSVGNIPNNWISTGTSIASMSDTANRNGVIDLGVIKKSITDISYAIQQKPVADDQYYLNVANTLFTANAPSGVFAGYPSIANYQHIALSTLNVNGLTGSDPEDCTQVASCNQGSNFEITSIDNVTKLYYDFGVNGGIQQVIPGTATATINNFDPSKMLIYGQNSAGTPPSELTFHYALIDAAGAKSEPAIFQISTNTPLPVVLLDFGAKLDKQNVLLQWKTAAEHNNRGFNILKSIDGKQWASIGFVNSLSENGNSATTLDYAFLDQSNTATTQYYKLEMQSFDGAKAISKVCVIKTQTNVLQLYPNPAHNQFAVKGLQADATASIVDMVGSIIFTQKIQKDNNTIDITALQDGVYQVLILQADGTIFHSKIVKQ